jgi:hypothetical protein
MQGDCRLICLQFKQDRQYFFIAFVVKDNVRRAASILVEARSEMDPLCWREHGSFGEHEGSANGKRRVTIQV